MTVPDIIETALDLGSRCGVKTWLELKKVLLLSLPAHERARFSTRDPETKTHALNEMERLIVDTYQKKTGVVLEVPR